jgi:osmoprotectant transport system permease protein
MGKDGGEMIFDAASPHTFVLALHFIVDNPQLLLTKAWEQIELSAAALAIALAIALPLGILLGHFHRGANAAIGASLLGRALPSIFLIAVFLTVLGLGFTNNMVALAVLAVGPILTNSYLGVEGVDADAVEAARGMGLSNTGILSRIELPLALPLIYIGIRVAAVTVVATAPIAAYAGGGGLGDVIANQATYRLSGVLAASICVMGLSVGVWLVLLALEKASTPRGVRMARVPARAGDNRKEGL